MCSESFTSEQMSKDHQVGAKKKHIIGKSEAKNKEKREQFRGDIMLKKR